MMADTKADERRMCERMSWACQARLLPLSLELNMPTPGIRHAMGRDISEGGIQVWSDRLFAVKSRLLLELEAPELPEGIQAVGSVAWVSATNSDDRWCVGIEFSDVGDTALTSLRALMQHPAA